MTACDFVSFIYIHHQNVPICKDELAVFCEYGSGTDLSRVPRKLVSRHSQPLPSEHDQETRTDIRSHATEVTAHSRRHVTVVQRYNAGSCGVSRSEALSPRVLELGVVFLRVYSVPPINSSYHS